MYIRHFSHYLLHEKVVFFQVIWKTIYHGLVPEQVMFVHSPMLFYFTAVATQWQSPPRLCDHKSPFLFLSGAAFTTTAAMGGQNKQAVSQRLRATTGNAKTILLCVVSERLGVFWCWVVLLFSFGCFLLLLIISLERYFLKLSVKLLVYPLYFCDFFLPGYTVPPESTAKPMNWM